MEEAGRRLLAGSPFDLRMVGRISLMAGASSTFEGLVGECIRSIPIKQVSL